MNDVKFCDVGRGVDEFSNMWIFVGIIAPVIILDILKTLFSVQNKIWCVNFI